MKGFMVPLLATFIGFCLATPIMAGTISPHEPMANYHGFWYVDIDGVEPRILDSNDGANPNGGVTRWWKEAEPQYHNQNFNDHFGSPYPGMSDWIGLNGQCAYEYASYTQTYTGGGPSDVQPGNSIISIMELDANVVTEPRVYYSTVDGPTGYGWTQRGTVPKGYVWAGNHFADVASDEEVFPGTTPPTTFFKLYKIPMPQVSSGTWSWSFPAHEANVVGNTAACIQSWQLLESVNYDDMDGPWIMVGNAAYGSQINYAAMVDYWYCVRIVWKGGVNSAVLSEPTNGWEPPPGPEATNLAANPNPHNGNTISEYVTLSATITDCCGFETLSAEYRVDGGPWIVFPQSGISPLAVSTVYNFPNGYTEGAHAFQVRGFDGYIYGTIASSSFTITDTTQPLAVWNTVPGATAYDALDLVFTAYYEDFTVLQTAIGSSYFWYSVNGGPQQHLAWNAIFDGYGSYLYSLSATIPGGTFLPGDVITYGGQVTDTAATPNTTPLGVGGPITMVAAPSLYDIPVIMGWNLISFPVNASGSPDIVLADAGGDTVWDVVKWYDGFTKTWKSYRIGSSANTLTYVDHTMGLWVHVTTLGDGLLGILGEPLGTTQINLYAGWNLVGYPSLTPRTVGEVLTGTNWDRAEVFDPAPPYIIPVGPDYVLNPGQGFWVKVPSDTVWLIYTPILTSMVITTDPTIIQELWPESVPVSAQGYDQNSNPMQCNPTWSDDASGTSYINVVPGSPATATLSADGTQIMGTYTITVEDGAISDTAVLQIGWIPGPTMLYVTPDPVWFVTGDTTPIVISAQAYDEFMFPCSCNPVWSDTEGTGAFINAVAGSPATVTYIPGPSPTPGTYQITAQDGLISGSCQLIIDQGNLSAISISPDPVTILGGMMEQVILAAQGYNEYGVPMMCAPAWSDDEGSGVYSNLIPGNPATVTYMESGFSIPGVYTIHAIDGPVLGTATLVIVV